MAAKPTGSAVAAPRGRRRARRAPGPDDRRAAASLAERLAALGTAWLAAADGARRQPTRGNVHRLRVVTRRLRAVLDLCAGSIDCESVAALRRALRRPFRRSGDLRDLDVLAELLAAQSVRHPAARELLPAVATAASERRRKLRRALRPDRCERIARRLGRVARRLAVRLGEPGGPVAIASGMAQRLVDLNAACRRAAVAAGRPAARTGADLHRARLAVKRLRYAREIAARAGHLPPGLPGPGELRSVQRCLGAVTDLGLLQAAVARARAGSAPPAGLRTLSTSVDRQAVAARRTARESLAVLAASNDPALAGTAGLASAGAALDTPGPAR